MARASFAVQDARLRQNERSAAYAGNVYLAFEVALQPGTNRVDGACELAIHEGSEVDTRNKNIVTGRKMNVAQCLQTCQRQALLRRFCWTGATIFNGVAARLDR